MPLVALGLIISACPSWAASWVLSGIFAAFVFVHLNEGARKSFCLSSRLPFVHVTFESIFPNQLNNKLQTFVEFHLRVGGITSPQPILQLAHHDSFASYFLLQLLNPFLQCLWGI